MKILFLLLTLSFCIVAEATLIEDCSNLKVLSPSLDTRKIRKLRLSNQLEVLLVSDPESPFSAASLVVNSGSNQDPISRAGLAHFTEHMLFLGNAKYPEEEDFSRFLDSHGGKRNAFTMTDRTAYMFSIANEGFKEGLDRFANFFISPNFTASGLCRECKAIHQEYCKNLPVDGWRMLYLKKALCNEKHSFHSFSIGNRDTLSDVTHEEIKAWYEENYSANLMHLCIYSNKSLEELEAIVTPLFEVIENRNVVHARGSEPLFTEKKEKSLCFVAPVQEQCCLELSWELPQEFAVDIERHTDRLASHILGHEGKQSLLTQLKKAGLAKALGCGKQVVATDEALFILSIDLTNKGAMQYERVISTCFDALQAIQREGLKRHIFEEMQKTEELRYCYQTRGDLFDYVTRHAMLMVDEPLESYPRKSLIPTTYDEEAFAQLIATLTPKRANYMLLAPPEFTGIFPNKEEKWMKVAYATKTIRPGLIKKWSKPNTRLGHLLPEPNPFIPTELKRCTASYKKEVNFALCLHEKREEGELFVAKDHCFLTPKACWQIHYKTPIVKQKEGNSAALIDLFVLSCKERLNEKLYTAKLAGLNCSLVPKEDGFVLTLHGFEEKIPLLAASIWEEFLTYQLTQVHFSTYKEMLLKEYECRLLESPLTQAGEMVSSILFEQHKSIRQKAEAAAELSLEEINDFSKNLFAKGYIECSCYGNTDKEACKKLFDTLLTPVAYPKGEHEKRKLARFATITQPTYLEERYAMPAGGLMVTLDFGEFSFAKRGCQEILSKALEEPFFSELRTRQQTAYVVTNWSQEIERHLYNFFAIQSSSHDPRDLLARFELFLESFMMNLEKAYLPKERFLLIKQSLVKQLTHPQIDFAKMGELFHKLAFEYEGDLKWLEKRAEALQELTYEEFLLFVKEAMQENRHKKIAVLIHGTFEREAPFTYELTSSLQSLKERLEYH